MRQAPHPYVEVVRRLFRRGMRTALQSIPSDSIKALAHLVPFSRFHNIASRLLWGEEIIDWRGVTIEVNPGHVLGYYAYFFGDYASAEIDKLMELCQQAHVFVDVGANAGLFSLALTHACPTLSAYAFEPNREVIANLRANLDRNRYLAKRIHVVEKAVGEVNGTGEFAPSPHVANPEVGRLASSHDQARSYDVPVVCLDSFFEMGPEPEVIKIDVEGAELQVLRGMTGLFTGGFPKALLVETHGLYFGAAAAEFNSQIVSELETGGFRLARLQSGTWVPLAEPLGAVSRSHLLALRSEA
jgi:FkbM family methyltransferase